MQVKPEMCPLVSADEVGVFNELDALMLESVENLPRLAASTRFKGEPDKHGDKSTSIKLDWEKLRTEIAKSHYLVGLLGVTGAGKSTTLNRLIGEEVLPQGSEGVPCTSVIQRIRFVPPEASPKIELRFLTERSWDERRQVIGQSLELLQHNNDLSDSELIERLEQTIEDVPTAAQSNVTLELSRFYLRFLKGGKHYRSRLGKGNVSKNVSSLKQLGSVLEVVASHRAQTDDPAAQVFGLDDSESALLSEVLIDIPLPNAPMDLELVDLPGFLAQSKQDDIVTKAYLEQLDGACVLISVQGLKYNVFDEIRRNLEERFGDLNGRVWLVITKIDSAGKDQINSERNSIFHGIDKAAKDWNITSDESLYNHLIITSNEINESIQGMSNIEKATIVPALLKLERTGTDLVARPKALAKDEDLQGIWRSFEHVLEDGGIGRLRIVIEQELSKTVRWQFRLSVLQRIVDMCEAVIRCFEAFRDQGGLKKEDHDVAIQWSNLFRQKLRQHDLVRSLVQNELEELQRKLQRLLSNYCPLDNLPAQKDLRMRHKNFSRSLLEDVAKELLGLEAPSYSGAISGIAGKAITRLKDRLLKLGKEQNLLGRGRELEMVIKPSDRMTECANELLTRHNHLEQYQGIACEQVFSETWPPEITPAMYYEMMERKIDNLLCESVHRLQNCLYSSLEEVQQRLENLEEEQGKTSIDPVSRDTYQSFIDRWNTLKASASTKHASLSQSKP